MIHTLSAEAAGSYEQIRSAIHADNHTVSIPANLEKEKKNRKKTNNKKPTSLYIYRTLKWE